MMQVYNAHGTKKFMEKFEKIMSGLPRLHDDLKQIHDRQTMPLTRSLKESSATVYYKFYE